MEATVLEKSRTGLSEQAGVQDKKQGCMVADVMASGKGILPLPEKVESVDDSGFRAEGLSEFQRMYILILIDMEEKGVHNIQIRRGIDEKRFVDFCQKLGQVSPHMFDCLEERFEAYVF